MGKHPVVTPILSKACKDINVINPNPNSFPIIFHDAPTIPDDSGGPLMNEAGDLIGIHSKMRLNKSLWRAVLDKVDTDKLIIRNIAEPIPLEKIPSLIQSE